MAEEQEKNLEEEKTKKEEKKDILVRPGTFDKETWKPQTSIGKKVKS